MMARRESTHVVPSHKCRRALRRRETRYLASGLLVFATAVLSVACSSSASVDDDCDEFATHFSIRVVDPKGEPICGSSVQLSPDVRVSPFPMSSPQCGSFVIGGGAPPGDYEVEASAEGYETSTVIANATLANCVSLTGGVTITLTPKKQGPSRAVSTAGAPGAP